MPSMYITSTVCMPHPNCKLTLVSFCVFMSVCLFVGAEVKSQNSWWSRMFLFFVRVASADQAASFLSFMPWSSQIFPRNQLLKNGPHAKSCHYAALQPNWLTQKRSIKSIWYEYSMDLLNPGKARFSMRSIFKNWFPGKIWLYPPTLTFHFNTFLFLFHVLQFL